MRSECPRHEARGRARQISMSGWKSEKAFGDPLAPRPVPAHLRAQLLPIAQRVFWWGQPGEWLNNMHRFVAQVMTFGDWDDVRTALDALGEPVFRETLRVAPPGVFDARSWNFWHVRFGEPVPPLPIRKLE